MAKDKRKRVDFDVDIYCKEAIRICNGFVDYKFDYSAESLSVMEEIIQHIRKMVREGKQNKEDLWAIACFFWYLCRRDIFKNWSKKIRV